MVAPPSLTGRYRCTSDGMLYEVRAVPKKLGGGLELRRRYPHEPEWRTACATTEQHIILLLGFGSFIRLDDTP